MQYNTQPTGSTATIWRGTYDYALAIFAKQDGLLYYGVPGTIYSLLTLFFIITYAVFFSASFLDNTGFPIIDVISLVVIVLWLVFAILGLSAVKRISATVTDINNLIKQPFSKTVLICEVNRITDKKRCFLVNCIFAHVKPNGQTWLWQTGNIRVPKDYYGVDILIQEFIALQKA